jgi:hypothetical protein
LKTASKIVEVRQGTGTDMFRMHQWIKQDPVDLLIGHTYGKYIARNENDVAWHLANCRSDGRIPNL